MRLRLLFGIVASTVLAVTLSSPLSAAVAGGDVAVPAPQSVEAPAAQPVTTIKMDGIGDVDLIKADEIDEQGTPWFYFKVQHSGKCITVHGNSMGNGAAVDQYTCLGKHNQQWTTNLVGTGYEALVVRHSRKCLDVPAASAGKKGTGLVQWECNEGVNQYFLGRSGGSFRPINHANFCLDIEGASKADNARLIQWDCKGVDNQKFHTQPV